MFFNVQDLWPENVEVILGIKNPIVIGAINSIVKKIYKHSDKILCSSDGFIENIKSRGVPEYTWKKKKCCRTAKEFYSCFYLLYNLHDD